MSEILTTETTVVWANTTGGGTGIRHPMTEAIRWGGISGVRVSVELDNAVGDLQLQAYYQSSDDGVNWGSADQFGPITTGGVAYGTSFYTGIYQAYQYVRFGVEAKNTGSTNLNLGYATLRLEFERC